MTTTKTMIHNESNVQHQAENYEKVLGHIVTRHSMKLPNGEYKDGNVIMMQIKQKSSGDGDDHQPIAYVPFFQLMKQRRDLYENYVESSEEFRQLFSKIYPGKAPIIPSPDTAATRGKRKTHTPEDHKQKDVHEPNKQQQQQQQQDNAISSQTTAMIPSSEAISDNDPLSNHSRAAKKLKLSPDETIVVDGGGDKSKEVTQEAVELSPPAAVEAVLQQQAEQTITKFQSALTTPAPTIVPITTTTLASCQSAPSAATTTTTTTTIPAATPTIARQQRVVENNSPRTSSFVPVEEPITRGIPILPQLHAENLLRQLGVAQDEIKSLKDALTIEKSKVVKLETERDEKAKEAMKYKQDYTKSTLSYKSLTLLKDDLQKQLYSLQQENNAYKEQVETLENKVRVDDVMLQSIQSTMNPNYMASIGGLANSCSVLGNHLQKLHQVFTLMSNRALFQPGTGNISLDTHQHHPQQQQQQQHGHLAPAGAAYSSSTVMPSHSSSSTTTATHVPQQHINPNYRISSQQTISPSQQQHQYQQQQTNFPLVSAGSSSSSVAAHTQTHESDVTNTFSPSLFDSSSFSEPVGMTPVIPTSSEISYDFQDTNQQHPLLTLEESAEHNQFFQQIMSSMS